MYVDTPYRRNDNVIAMLGRVMRIEPSKYKKQWNAIAFVATDAHSFQAQLSHYQVTFLK